MDYKAYSHENDTEASKDRLQAKIKTSSLMVCSGPKQVGVGNGGTASKTGKPICLIQS